MRRRAIAATASLLAALACGGQQGDPTAAPERTADKPAQKSVAAAPAPAPAPSAPAEPAPPAEAEPPPEPGLPRLTEAQRATLLAGDEDPFVDVETHYLHSNETRHDLFFPYVAGKGGAYVGVGSDQNYTLAAVAGAELMLLFDIDARAVDVHLIYEVLVQRAETPQALRVHFEEGNRDATMAVLDEALASKPDDVRRRVVRTFKVGRETLLRHIDRIIDRTVDGEPASWMSKPELYAHVRDLFRKGRVRIMAGNLTGTRTMQSVAAAAKAFGTPVQVLYLSNAEEYFKYTHGGFAAGVKALPHTADSVVLRTIYSKEWEHADLWAYQVQPLDDFRARLDDRKNRSRKPMLRYAERDKTLDRSPGPKGLTLIGKPTRGPGAPAP